MPMPIIMDRHIWMLLAVLLALVFFIQEAESRGGRGGGGARGGARGGSRGGARGSRGSSGSRYSARGGSRRSSSYISYIPTARYSRAYGTYRGYYYYYYNLYFYHSGTYVYHNRRRSTGDYDVCANYEASDNGTVMGVFVCPNEWEPANFTYCCGEDYAEYCCTKPPLSWGAYFGISIAVLAVLVICAVIIQKLAKTGCCTKGCRKIKHERYRISLPPSTSTPGAARTTNYPSNPVETPSPYTNQAYASAPSNTLDPVDTPSYTNQAYAGTTGNLPYPTDVPPYTSQPYDVPIPEHQPQYAPPPYESVQSPAYDQRTPYELASDQPPVNQPVVMPAFHRNTPV